MKICRFCEPGEQFQKVLRNQLPVYFIRVDVVFHRRKKLLNFQLAVVFIYHQRHVVPDSARVRLVVPVHSVQQVSLVCRLQSHVLLLQRQDYAVVVFVLYQEKHLCFPKKDKVVLEENIVENFFRVRFYGLLESKCHEFKILWRAFVKQAIKSYHASEKVQFSHPSFVCY